MYNTRLKQWNLRKNYRAEEKELLAAQIVEAHLENRPASDLTFKNRPVKLDRVLRHLRTKKRKAAAMKTSKNRDGSTGGDGSSSDSSTSRIHQDESCRSKTRWPVTITPDSGNTTSTVLTPPSTVEDIEDDFEMIERDDLVPSLPEPSPTLSPPRGSLNTELILYQTREYYHHQISRACPGTLSLQHPSLTFWKNVKNGIYFLKKQSPHLAWPLLNDACGSALEVFSQTPLLFLSDVFGVLSPVNTKVCPQVRTELLRYLVGMASIKFQSKNHPLVIVLRELCTDTPHGEASETALNLTLTLFAQILGPDHTATFAVYRSFISLLRRDKRLEQAKQQAECLVETCKQSLVLGSAFGIPQLQRPSIGMIELCIALTELVHTYMDLQEHHLAKSTCGSILHHYKIIQGSDFPNNRAAYAMEDMAEICILMGEREEALSWMRSALQASSRLRGAQDASTEHIKDKFWELVKGSNCLVASEEGILPCPNRCWENGARDECQVEVEGCVGWQGDVNCG